MNSASQKLSMFTIYLHVCFVNLQLKYFLVKINCLNSYNAKQNGL